MNNNETPAPPPRPHDVRVWHDNHYRRTGPETRPGWWQRFEDAEDPYNPGNTLSGCVQRAGGDEYGSLSITHVNGRPAPQRIIATPKAAYPYRPDRAWLLNRADSIQSYVKYDGTNICQYAYQDADGNTFTSFKLRTRPFVPPRFQNLLNRCLTRYPAVARLQLRPGEAMLYELYGKHNPMLIEYDEEIELRALCRRNPETGDIETPNPAAPAFARLDCPLAEPESEGIWRNIQEEYVRRQTVHSRSLTEFRAGNGEKMFRGGGEGEMLYVAFPDGDRTEPGPFTRLIKLKPPQIEEIHQALDHVPRQELEATVRNVFEASDAPGITDFVELLAEEWSGEQISRSWETAERVLAEALEKREMEDGIIRSFREHFRPSDFFQDSAAVMRRLSQEYPRQQMSRVYSALAARLPYEEEDLPPAQEP